MTARSIMGLVAEPGVVRGSIRFDGTELLGLDDVRVPQAPRHGARDGLPGLVVVVEPRVPRRNADRRGRPRALERVARRGARAGRRAVGPGRDTPGRGAGAAVPARVLGRHAAAGDDRHGDRQCTAPRHRRRTDDRARRHDPGPGARRAARRPARHRRGAPVDHPRPRGRRRHRRSGRGDVRREPIVEEGTLDEVFLGTRHPYTRGLLDSVPRAPVGEREPLLAIPGRPPSLLGLPAGCPLAPRCAYAVERCRRRNRR